MQPASPQHGTAIATLLVGQKGFGLMPTAPKRRTCGATTPSVEMRPM